MTNPDNTITEQLPNPNILPPPEPLVLGDRRTINSNIGDYLLREDSYSLATDLLFRPINKKELPQICGIVGSNAISISHLGFKDLVKALDKGNTSGPSVPPKESQLLYRLGITSDTETGKEQLVLYPVLSNDFDPESDSFIPNPKFIPTQA